MTLRSKSIRIAYPRGKTYGFLFQGFRCIHTWIHIWVQWCMYRSTHVHLWKHNCTYRCIHVCMYAWEWTLYIHIHLCKFECTYAWYMHVEICTHACMEQAYPSMHLYMWTNMHYCIIAWANIVIYACSCMFTLPWKHVHMHALIHAWIHYM